MGMIYICGISEKAWKEKLFQIHRPKQRSRTAVARTGGVALERGFMPMITDQMLAGQMPSLFFTKCKTV